MKKIGWFIYLFIFILAGLMKSHGQSKTIDSIRLVIKKLPDDTNKVNSLLTLSNNLWGKNLIAEASQSCHQAIDVSGKIGFAKGKTTGYRNLGNFSLSDNDYIMAKLYFDSSLNIALESNDKNEIGFAYSALGTMYNWEDNYAKSLEYHHKALKLFEESHFIMGIGLAYQEIGYIYYNQDQFEDALKNHLASLHEFRKTGNQGIIAYGLKNTGDAFLKTGNYKQAFINLDSALKIFKKSGNELSWEASALTSLGNLYNKLGELDQTDAKNDTAVDEYKKALDYYQQSHAINEMTHFNIQESELNLGNIYVKLQNFTEAEKHLQRSLSLSKSYNSKRDIRDAYLSLSKFDSTLGRFKEAYLDYRMYNIFRDSVTNEESIRKTTQENLQYEFDKKTSLAKAEQDARDEKVKRTRNIQYILTGFILLVAIFLFLNNRQKQKAKLKIETAYSDLKSTQQQLIQAEKMASLGELTAGIAHEIQNPLNFVNNFSEVSNELIDEMKTELDKGDIEEAKFIAADIKQNLEKINHHGKRADSIVKGMLQHSRSSSGQKELTDINSLCDEYLRLSYHGLRAKDKSFNATLKTDFDDSVGKINVMPQELGRVILNIINNAFYAVNEKKKMNIEGYEPTVSVATKKLDNKIKISIADNGNGIPDAITEKIFQPFFTTKPTGLGTGLGLSLSYDIITKGHGGALNVETKFGEGSKFIILLPE